LHRWAWEFLRRNPEFEAEMHAAIEAQRPPQALHAAGKLRPLGWKQTPKGAVLFKWGDRFPSLPGRPELRDGGYRAQ